MLWWSASVLLSLKFLFVLAWVIIYILYDFFLRAFYSYSSFFSYCLISFRRLPSSYSRNCILLRSTRDYKCLLLLTSLKTKHFHVNTIIRRTLLHILLENYFWNTLLVRLCRSSFVVLILLDAVWLYFDAVVLSYFDAIVFASWY